MPEKLLEEKSELRSNELEFADPPPSGEARIVPILYTA